MHIGKRRRRVASSEIRMARTAPPGKEDSGTALGHRPPCRVRVVISTRAFSGMKRSGRGMHAYRQATSPSCFVRNPDGSDSTPGKRRLWHRPRAPPALQGAGGDLDESVFGDEAKWSRHACISASDIAELLRPKSGWLGQHPREKKTLAPPSGTARLAGCGW